MTKQNKKRGSILATFVVQKKGALLASLMELEKKGTAFGHQPTAMLFVHNKSPLFAKCITIRIMSSSCCASFTSEPKADSLFCAIC